MKQVNKINTDISSSNDTWKIMKDLFNNRSPNLPSAASNLRFSFPWGRIGYSILEFFFKIFK